MDAASFFKTLESNLPTLPHVAWQAVRLVEDPESSASDLERLISRDQALVGRVLRLVNSAFFGVRRPITTVSQAIVTLGFGNIHSLVMATACESLHQGKSFKKSCCGTTRWLSLW